MNLFDTTPTREEELELIRRMYQLPPEHEFVAVELRVAEMLREAGARGLRVNAEILVSETAKIEAELNSLQREIDRLARRPVRVGSSADLAHLLFDELRFPCAKQTRKGRPSFDAESLKKYDHPIAGLC